MERGSGPDGSRFLAFSGDRSPEGDGDLWLGLDHVDLHRHSDVHLVDRAARAELSSGPIEEPQFLELSQRSGGDSPG